MATSVPGWGIREMVHANSAFPGCMLILVTIHRHFDFVSLGFFIPQGYNLWIKSKDYEGLANYSAKSVTETKLIYVFYE